MIEFLIKLTESIPILNIFSKHLYWLWDYIYAWTCMLRWAVMKEIFTSHLKINYKRDLQDRKGETVVITGGTRGIGAKVIEKLLLLEMNVVMGCRNVSDGAKLYENLLNRGFTKGSFRCFKLDLASFKSVRAFADQINSSKIRVNLLINNAGIMGGEFKETEDGLESHFQVNFLSHFLLTNLLLDNIIKTSKKSWKIGNIINVSSSTQYDAKVNFNDLELRNRYNPYIAYFNSKWMLVAMTRYLDTQLQKDNLPVRVNSLHPGVVPTDIAISHLKLPLFAPLIKWTLKQILFTEDEAADEVIFVSLSNETSRSGGEYYVFRKACPFANDTPRIQKILWDKASSLTSLNS